MTLPASSPTCVLCDRRPPGTPGRLTCTPCLGRLDETLDAICDLAGRLDPTPGAGGLSGGRRPPGFGSRAPARDHVIALEDRRTRFTDRPDQARPVDVVGYWCDHGRDAGVIPHRDVLGTRGGVRYLGGEVNAVRDMLGWFCEQPFIVDMARDLNTVRAGLERACGEAVPLVVIGACPVVLDPLAPPAGWLCATCRTPVYPPGITSPPLVGPIVCEHCRALAAIVRDPGPVCGEKVRARAFGEPASCSAGHAWRSLDDLRALAAALGGALLDVPALARYFDRPESTIRTWAHRDGWTPHGTPGRRGRRLYDLNDARLSWLSRARNADEANPVAALAS